MILHSWSHVHKQNYITSYIYKTIDRISFHHGVLIVIVLWSDFMIDWLNWLSPSPPMQSDQSTDTILYDIAMMLTSNIHPLIQHANTIVMFINSMNDPGTGLVELLLLLFIIIILFTLILHSQRI